MNVISPAGNPMDRVLSVRARLDAFGRRIRRALLLEGAVWVAGGIVAVVILTLALDRLFRLEPAARWSLLALAALGLGFLSHRRIVRPARLAMDPLDVAAVIDRLRPGLAQHAANAIELGCQLNDTKWASPELTAAAVREAVAEIEGVDFAAMFNHGRRKKFLGALCLAAALPVLFFFLWPEASSIWVRRWLLGADVRWPQSTYLALVGLEEADRILTPRGEPLVLEVTSSPPLHAEAAGWRVAGRGAPFLVESKTPPASSPPDQVRYELKDPSGKVTRDLFTRFAADQFRAEIPSVLEPLELKIVGGDDWFGPIRIIPIDRPAVAKLEIVALPPGQSPAEPETYSGSDTQLLFLAGTELELRLTTTEPVAKGSLSAANGTAPPLEMRSDQSFRAKWTMKEPLTLEINFVGRDTGLSSRPHFLSFGLLEDRPPRVTVRSTGVGRRVTPMARIPLDFQARDDFGLQEFSWVMEKTTPGAPAPETLPKKLLPLPEHAETPILDVERQATALLAEATIPVGGLLRIQASATDRCAKGAQTGSSRWLTFQVVAPDELFYEILVRQRAERSKFKTAVDQANEQLEALKLEVSGNDVPSLQRRHQVISRQASQTANQLSATVEELRLNVLGSPQSLEILEKSVIGPLGKLNEGALPKMGRILQEMRVDPAALVAKKSDALAAQAEIAGEMRKILAQMAQWESFVDVVNQLKDVIEMQSRISKAAEERLKKNLEKIFEK